MENFDLDAFIAGINNDRQQPKQKGNYLTRVLMNTRENQGTLTFVPCYSSKAKNFYIKLNRIYEFYGATSLINNGEAWYRILPIDMYNLTETADIELYNEVKGYLDYLLDQEVLGYDELRVRNYSLFYGMGRSLKSTEGKMNEDVVDSPCLFVYPSANPITQMCDAINQKIDAMNGRKDWIPMILTPNATGRKGVVQVKFIKAEGPGYDCTVVFEFNNEFNTIIDPSYEIGEDHLKLFDDVIPTFLGWIYDNESKSYFNRTAFKELRDNLKVRIKSLNPTQEVTEEVPENKNNLSVDPSGQMTQQKRTVPF
jgi:hypothetical protein